MWQQKRTAAILRTLHTAAAISHMQHTAIVIFCKPRMAISRMRAISCVPCTQVLYVHEVQHKNNGLASNKDNYQDLCELSSYQF